MNQRKTWKIVERQLGSGSRDYFRKMTRFEGKIGNSQIHDYFEELLIEVLHSYTSDSCCSVDR